MKLAHLDHLAQHKRIFIALSGGLDSMVLLDYLSKCSELKSKLRVIHVNHGISPHAASWTNFCKQACEQRELPFQSQALKLKLDHNLEDRARKARYKVFFDLTNEGDALVLAHHLDDQIETFLLNALRGSGLTGLAAMPSSRDFWGRQLYRPMLKIRRSEIKAYAQSEQLSWIEDESNQNPKFSRNFLRLDLLPLIETHWPQYRQSLAHTIDDCQLELEAQEHYFKDKMVIGSRLDKDVLLGLSQYEIYAYLRLWFKKNQVSSPSRTVLDEIWRQFFLNSRQDANPRVLWANVVLRAYANILYLDKTDAIPILESMVWHRFPQPIAGWQAIENKRNEGVWINPKLDQVEIRFRQGGEQIFYHGHHRCLKKLLQAMKIPPWLRSAIPLLYVNGELRGVIGYFYADKISLKDGDICYQIKG